MTAITPAPVAAKTPVAKPAYMIQVGCGCYVAKDGVRITAPGGIIAEYADKYSAELEENVAAGLMTRTTIDGAIHPYDSSIASMEIKG